MCIVDLIQDATLVSDATSIKLHKMLSFRNVNSTQLEYKYCYVMEYHHTLARHSLPVAFNFMKIRISFWMQNRPNNRFIPELNWWFTFGHISLMYNLKDWTLSWSSVTTSLTFNITSLFSITSPGLRLYSRYRKIYVIKLYLTLERSFSVFEWLDCRFAWSMHVSF